MIEEQVVSAQECREEIQTVDFGKDAFGWLEVELTGKGGEEVELAIGEVIRDGRINRDPGGFRCFRKMNLILREGTHTYRFEIPPHVAPNPALPKCYPPEEAGGEIAPFRYAEIRGYSGAFKAVRHAVFAPFDDNAADFRCSDERLNRIWEFCKYSIKATTAFGMYVDGERERLPYEGDAYINQLGHFCCDAGYDMARRTIEYFFGHPTWPTEWRLITVLLARDYALYSGDEESIRRWMPELKEKLLLNHAGTDLLIRGTQEVRDIVDWPVGERDGYEFGEVNLVPNCYHYGALLAMYELSREEWYLRRAAEVKQAIRGSMLKNGLFVDHPGSTHTSLHSAMFAIRFGVADAAEYPALVSVIRSRGMACSVYGAQFLLEACYRCGLADHALALMVGGGLRSWRNMLDKGATITMEAWDDSLKPNQDWNHAWGAAPANIIPRGLCGIRPLSPGFGMFDHPVAGGAGNARYSALRRYRTAGGVGPYHCYFRANTGAACSETSTSISNCLLRLRSSTGSFCSGVRLSAAFVEPLLRMPWTQRCSVECEMSYSSLISRAGLPFS